MIINSFDSTYYYLIYPGSFNKLHYGHLAVANHAEKLKNIECLFEISSNCFDKNGICNQDELCNQFDILGRKVTFTKWTSFLQKSLNFPIGANFIVGADTLLRILDPKYYFDSQIEMERCHNIISKRSKFIVYPRNGIKLDRNKFGILDSVITLVTDFAEIPVSSTELRSKGK